MSITITIKKIHLAVAVLAVAVLAPATAYATHIFTDVPDSAFYAEPVKWAFDNGITTGTSPTTFEPLDDVTRGESVTFLQRYDTNIVQPALDDIDSKGEVDGAIQTALENRAWSESMPISNALWLSGTAASWTIGSGGSQAPDGLTLHDVSYGRFWHGFTLPPDYQAGDDVAISISWMADTDNTVGCTFRLEDNGTSVLRGDAEYGSVSTQFEDGPAPTGSFPYVILTASNEGSPSSFTDNTVQQTRLILDGTDFEPGDEIRTAIARRSAPSTASHDSCTGGLTILGLTALPG